MALKVIAEDCISCGACEPECPNEAISETPDTYVINPDLCTECVGAFDQPQCVGVCPQDCIKPDPNHTESKEALQAKYNKLHG